MEKELEILKEKEVKQLIANINENMSSMTGSEIGEEVFKIVLEYGDEITNDEKEALENLGVKYVEEEDLYDKITFCLSLQSDIINLSDSNKNSWQFAKNKVRILEGILSEILISVE